MTGLFLAVSSPAARLLNSPDVAIGVMWAAPGLVCFALNKVILAAHNGLGRLRLYAVLQAGRFVFMLAGFGFLLPRAALPALLSIGEGATLIVALVTIRRELGAPSRRWIREHLRFGVKAFPSGLFSELNTRIDVLILGAFATDGVVGVYSLAAILAEGLYQLLIAVRTTYAPALVEGLPAEAIARGRNRTYLGAAAVAVLAIPAYALFIGPSWPLFGILVAGMVSGAGYVPFSQILVCRGWPGWHTAMILTVLLYNAAANAVLVPHLGSIGAASATGSTFLVAAVLTRFVIGRVVEPA
jgi:O-antigen/teichoic acid export membrane protein